MKDKCFNEIVWERAGPRIDKKVEQFRQTCSLASDELFGRECPGALQRRFYAVLASDTPYTGWPKLLWDNEERRVKEELLPTEDPEPVFG